MPNLWPVMWQSFVEVLSLLPKTTANVQPFFEKNCKRDPVSGGKYASKTWSFCNALLKNFRAQHPLKAEIWSLKKTLWVDTT